MHSLASQELLLPSEVNNLSEEQQMALAYAVEERNCLQAEIDLASRRCRQHVFAAHGQALRAQKLASKFDSISKQVAVSVKEVVHKAQSDGEYLSSSTGGKFILRQAGKH